MEDQTPLGGDEELRAELSTAAINDLPDSDFAYIEPGGEKDADGKTVPRSLRHFPIHDEAHVRNALARAPQSPFGDKAMPKILKAAKKFGIDVQQNSDSMEIVLREEGESSATTLTRTAVGDVLTPVTVTRRRAKRERHRAVPLLPEVRHFRAEGLEIRSNSQTDEIVITGTPIVYDQDYTVHDMFGEFTERMRPGVASDALSNGADVRFLFNHDGMPLARTASGTMSLRDTDDGLTFSARLDARQQLANDLAVAIERGDVSQMSCGFIVAQDEWDESMEDRSIIRLADLLDVSAVTYPASPTTSISIAQRMALQVPVESRARLRAVYVDLRAGKALSAANQDKLLSAVGTLHDVLTGAGVDLSQLDPDHDGDIDTAPDAGAELEPDVNVSDDATTGGNDTAESGVGADGFPADQTRAAEPGEPIQYLAKAAVDQAWLDSLIERGESQHGSARKRAA